MSDRDTEGVTTDSSVEELLDLLGLNGRHSGHVPQPSRKAQAVSRAPRATGGSSGATPLSTEVLRCGDGVRRLHVYGCGHQPVKLSRTRCQALLRGWEQLTVFSGRGGVPGAWLTDQIAVREVNGMVVVEIGGEIGRPMRFTPEKLGKLLHAREAILGFASS